MSTGEPVPEGMIRIGPPSIPAAVRIVIGSTRAAVDSQVPASRRNCLKEALKLPPEVRAALAGSLLDSLEPEVDEDTEAA